MGKLEKCGWDSSTLRELGSHLNNKNARSLINYTSVLLEHSLFACRWQLIKAKVTSGLSRKNSWSAITPATGLDVAHGTSKPVAGVMADHEAWMWHMAQAPSAGLLYTTMQDIHATPPSFLHVDHPEVSPSLTFLVASNSKPLIRT